MPGSCLTRFDSGSTHVRHFLNISLHLSPLSIVSDSEEIRCIQLSYGTIEVLQKAKSWSFGLDCGENEPTSVFHATTDPSQISSRLLDIREKVLHRTYGIYYLSMCVCLALSYTRNGVVTSQKISAGCLYLTHAIITAAEQYVRSFVSEGHSVDIVFMSINL